MDINQLSGQIIGAAIEIHKALGPGLLESAYENGTQTGRIIFIIIETPRSMHRVFIWSDLAESKNKIFSASSAPLR